MRKVESKPALVAILLGILIATAPDWLFGKQAMPSYEAPWNPTLQLQH